MAGKSTSAPSGVSKVLTIPSKLNLTLKLLSRAGGHSNTIHHNCFLWCLASLLPKTITNVILAVRTFENSIFDKQSYSMHGHMQNITKPFFDLSSKMEVVFPWRFKLLEHICCFVLYLRVLPCSYLLLIFLGREWSCQSQGSVPYQYGSNIPRSCRSP